MNIKLAASCIVVSVLMLPITGYSAESGSDSSSAKTFVKDSVITTKIKTGLAEDKMSSLVHIKVDTDNRGVVTLSGNVANQKEADEAVAIARAVNGVTSVESHIKVNAE